MSAEDQSFSRSVITTAPQDAWLHLNKLLCRPVQVHLVRLIPEHLVDSVAEFARNKPAHSLLVLAAHINNLDEASLL